MKIPVEAQGICIHGSADIFKVVYTESILSFAFRRYSPFKKYFLMPQGRSRLLYKAVHGKAPP